MLNFDIEGRDKQGTVTSYVNSFPNTSKIHNPIQSTDSADYVADVSSPSETVQMVRHICDFCFLEQKYLIGTAASLCRELGVDWAVRPIEIDCM